MSAKKFWALINAERFQKCSASCNEAYIYCIAQMSHLLQSAYNWTNGNQLHLINSTWQRCKWRMLQTAPPLPTSLCRDPAFVRCIRVKRDRLQERKSVISEHTQLSDGTHLGRGHIKGNTRISFVATRFSTDISAICVEILGWLVLGGKQSRTNIYMSLLTAVAYSSPSTQLMKKHTLRRDQLRS